MDIYLYNILTYNRNYIEYQIRYLINNYTIGIEGISMIVIGIIVTIIPIVLMIKSKGESKIMTIMIILIILLISQDIFIYYITYEVIIMPIYYFITKEGSKYTKYLTRQEAGLRILIYTIVGGIMILGGIIIGITRYGTTDNEIMNYIINREGEKGIKEIINTLYIISFFMKIPIFPFHIWLPIAHSESPTYGSVILASIILKIASYGIIRYNLPILSIEEINKYNIMILISIIIGSIIPINGVIDIKKIIAYSSIVHMGISTLGIIMKEWGGIEGGIIIMIAHGWISGGLFILVGNLYKRYKTRISIYYTGLSKVYPIWSTLLFLYLLSNISIPITYGFIGEIKVIEEISKKNIGITIIMMIGILLTNMMIIYRITRMLYGETSKLIEKEGYKDMNKKEILMIIPGIIYIYGIIWKPDIITGIIKWGTILLSI